MMIYKPAKKVLLNVRDTRRITTVIPTAKTFQYKGATLVAVPHRLDETKVLRNIGFKVPAPIRSYYDWPGRHKPFKAQIDTAEFLTLNPRAFCLNDMGTGKTLATLWAYDYLRKQGLVNRMLVLSPLSTLERTWADEIFRNFPHLNAGVAYGTAEKRVKVLKGDFDVYLMNHDGVKVKSVLDALISRTDIDVVVIDEVATLRNAGTQRWKATARLTQNKPYLWGLTGTPTPNEPTDAWAQCRLISPHRVPKYRGAFRDQVMRQVSEFKWIPREGATQIVAEAMQPAIRFKRDDCIDLPPCIYQYRSVKLTDGQSNAYKSMLDDLSMTFQGTEVLAVNEAVKMSKLIQIACGVIYDEDGRELILPNEPRISEVIDIIEQAGTKVIVFVPFRSVVNYVAKRLADHFTVETIHGSVSKSERDRIFRAFQHETAPRVLVAQPAAMSHGLTLTAASTVVWYAPVSSNETYEQANARIVRPGQKHTQFIVNIEGSEVERRVYARLVSKQKMQGLLLDLVKGTRGV